MGPLRPRGIRPCAQAEGAFHVYHQYVIRADNRDELRSWCAERGVGTAVHYPVPVHLQPAYADKNAFPTALAGLPETERASHEVLSLPMYPQLRAEEVERVAEILAEWVEVRA